MDTIEESTVEATAEATALSIALDTVNREVAAFDKINAGLKQLRTDYPVDVVVDVATTAGMKSAIVARAAYRGPRIALEHARKAAKAPVLELGKDIDALAGTISKELSIGEDWYDKQIKAQEELKAKQKAEADAKEAERVHAIHGRISLRFRTVPMRFAGKGSDDISAAVQSMLTEPLAEIDYAEFLEQATQAKEDALAALRGLLAGAVAREEEDERQRLLAIENAHKAEELRKQQEDFLAEQRRHREEVERSARALFEREEAARKEREAEEHRIAEAKREIRDKEAAIERARLDAEAAEKRAKQAEEQKRLDEEAATERARMMEETRVANEAREKAAQEAQAAADAERAAAAKAAKRLTRLHKLAPRMLEALKKAMHAVENNLGEEIAAIIAEAEGEPS